ncbi:hypothetical protein Cflav_PD4015 [Pedosphaera parvula Ellin514]|uniref:Uncharacterized protein n=1 Tax=Pedosphaera parvula (strain Ellin514) TaxID=320771 RepID=B9XGS5_PEDPL|nr:hypothetical protein Cflav_PD4015 [Pedosphaera parvula Ellin514]
MEQFIASRRFDREALTTPLPEDLPTDFGSTIPSPPETKSTVSRIAPRPG